MTITEFLEARIAEDEAAAQDAPTAQARVLSECAAKRAVIADIEGFIEALDWLNAALPGNLSPAPEAPWRTSTYRHLAAVYADHPDYRHEWAPA